MEFIIRGKRVELEKENCFYGIDEEITKDLAGDTLDIRRAISSLDKLGHFVAEDENFLVPELMELGFSKDEAIQIKKDSLAVLSQEELYKKISVFDNPYFEDRMIPNNSVFREFIG